MPIAKPLRRAFHLLQQGATYDEVAGMLIQQRAVGVIWRVRMPAGDRRWRAVCGVRRAARGRTMSCDDFLGLLAKRTDLADWIALVALG